MAKKLISTKAIVCTIAAVCLICLITSALAFGIDMGHDCVGEECFICLCVSLREHIFRVLLAAAVVSIVCTEEAIRAIRQNDGEDICTVATPVRLKVKLSN